MAGWQERNARARRLGYESYYDYRAHDYGRIPAGEPRQAGSALRLSRGHAGPADLERLLRSGQVAVLSQEPVGDRRADGTYTEVRVTAQLTDGRQARFRLRGHQLRRGGAIDDLRAAVTDAGTDIYSNPSLDVLMLVDQGEIDDDDVDLDEYDLEDEGE